MMFAGPIIAIIIIAVIVVGFLIGAVSIGGVVIVPLLVLLTDIEIHVAVASVIFTTIFTGALGTYMFARVGAVDWPSCLWLSIGAMAEA